MILDASTWRASADMRLGAGLRAGQYLASGLQTLDAYCPEPRRSDFVHNFPRS
jgi:hypothetical protein